MPLPHLDVLHAGVGQRGEGREARRCVATRSWSRPRRAGPSHPRACPAGPASRSRARSDRAPPAGGRRAPGVGRAHPGWGPEDGFGLPRRSPAGRSSPPSRGRCQGRPTAPVSPVGAGCPLTRHRRAGCSSSSTRKGRAWKTRRSKLAPKKTTVVTTTTTARVAPKMAERTGTAFRPDPGSSMACGRRWPPRPTARWRRPRGSRPTARHRQPGPLDGAMGAARQVSQDRHAAPGRRGGGRTRRPAPSNRRPPPGSGRRGGPGRAGPVATVRRLPRKGQYRARQHRAEQPEQPVGRDHGRARPSEHAEILCLLGPQTQLTAEELPGDEQGRGRARDRRRRRAPTTAGLTARSVFPRAIAATSP